MQIGNFEEIACAEILKVAPKTKLKKITANFFAIENFAGFAEKSFPEKCGSILRVLQFQNFVTRENLVEKIAEILTTKFNENSKNVFAI